MENLAVWGAIAVGIATALLLLARLFEPHPFLGTGWGDDERVADAERRDAHRKAFRLAALLATATWTPLVVLATVQGVAWGDAVEVPLLGDFVPWGLLLVAVPILVIGEELAGRRLGQTVAQFKRAQVLEPDDAERFSTLVARAEALWSSSASSWILLLLTVATTAATAGAPPQRLLGGVEPADSWQMVSGSTTLAGWWSVVVGLTVLRFLLLRWTWRLVLWTGVVLRLSRLSIRPRSSHPDRAGGMAFLGEAQTGFNALILALGVRLSCAIANAVVYGGAHVQAFLPHMATLVVLALVAVLAPLAFFAPRMAAARNRDLLFYSQSGYLGARHLERQLRAALDGELPTDAVSGLADLGPSYENVRRMWPFPFDVYHVLRVVVAAMVTFLPLTFLEVPAEAVFETLLRLVV